MTDLKQTTLEQESGNLEMYQTSEGHVAIRQNNLKGQPDTILVESGLTQTLAEFLNKLNQQG